MISLLNKKILNIFKFFFYPLIVLFLLFEIFFQIVFFFDIKPLKKTILFYNPYCNQKYWDNEISSNFNENIYTPHPILTFIKKENQERFNANVTLEKSDIIFYGSSFIDHKYFIPNFKNKINYGVKSYGLDQIYTSYKITKKNHPQKLIVIGFLPEDLDRTLFNHRNFPKLKYEKKNLIYEISNTPISLENKNPKEISFYVFNFIKNITFLIKNKYDYKTSECKITFKKDIFKFFINDIILNSKNLNQKIIFITFSFLEDVEDPNWRYFFIKNYFDKKKVIHLDSIKILKNDMIKKNLNPIDYYSSKDFHLNEYGFKIIAKELNKIIEQYK